MIRMPTQTGLAQFPRAWIMEEELSDETDL
jgi:hypothetical protein